MVTMAQVYAIFRPLNWVISDDMNDPRVTQLAKMLCSHSVRLQKGESVLIHAFDVDDDVIAEFVNVAYSFGAKVYVRNEKAAVRRAMMMGMSEDNAKGHAAIESFEMQQMQAYIAIRGTRNGYELAEVPSDINTMWSKEYTTPVVFGIRVPKTKWVALKWPTPSFAQMASMSTAAFEDFYFKVCCLDYAKMARAAQPLEDLMNATDRVKIVGPGTDLEFSIKGVGAVKCCGEANIPDGECFSAPVRESMNGKVTYNTVSLYQGVEFKDISFTVKNGKIIDATCNGNKEKLNEILDTDEGGRYFGEWAIGFHPHVLHPMKDTLFDEKIAGSFHLTPGNAYDPPGGNGNKSSIHWDIVCIQRPDYGGGEIHMDGKLVRKDGIFVLPELAALNPDQLG
jgi:aminopeptidase